MQRAVVRVEGPIEVVVGRFGDVIGRGLLQILSEDAGLRVVNADLDHAALELAVARHEVEVAILDEDSAAMAQLPRRLRQERPGVGVVALAHRPTRAYATRVLAFGVGVCVSTEAPALEIARAVRLAAGGGHAFVSTSARTSRPPVWAYGVCALTRREREVLELLSEGLKHAEVAAALRVSTETARSHAKHIYQKLGVGSRKELVGAERQALGRNGRVGDIASHIAGFS